MSQHNEIANIQRIYNALYYGRMTYFKSRPQDYAKLRFSMAQIEEYGRKKPASVTAKALKIYKTELAINHQIKTLTGSQREYKKNQLENWVFAEIHRYCVSHSGFFPEHLIRNMSCLVLGKISNGLSMRVNGGS